MPRKPRGRVAGAKLMPRKPRERVAQIKAVGNVAPSFPGSEAREILLTGTREEWRLFRQRWDWLIIESVDLGKRDLAGFDFSRCHLHAIGLSGSVLDHASFAASQFVHCVVSSASLCYASLHGAHVIAGSFARSTLRGADLTDSIWSAQTTLALVNFDEALLFNTSFVMIDSLHLALNLDKAMQAPGGFMLSRVFDTATGRRDADGENHIDFQTLEWSERLPPGFLRSCGLPEWLVRYYAEGKGPPRTVNAFLSYATEDSDDLTTFSSCFGMVLFCLFTIVVTSPDRTPLNRSGRRFGAAK